MMQYSQRYKFNKGFILLPVVFTLTILAAVAYLLSREGAINAGNVNREQQENAALYIAQAGYNHAVWQLNQQNCTGYTDISSTSFGTHSYSTVLTDSTGATLTAGSPANIKAIGTHANGASYTINRDRVKIYQFPVQQTVLQPDADNGKDTYLYKWKKTWNYGLSTTLWVYNTWADSLAYSLLNFDVSAIPSEAKIISTKLELWQNTPSANGGTVSVRRILSDWIEGTETGGTGSVNWNDRDSGVAWTSPGGDYSSIADASTNIPAATVGWYQWDISNLASDWFSGVQVNSGFILIPESVDTYVEFNSSDSTDPTLRPKLTISYACECGVICTGTGQNLLLVVVDPANLTTQESAKKVLIESWGYTITLIDVNDSQSAFNTAVSNSDVAYITEDINSGDLGTKLTNATIGVVTEEDNLSDEFGLAAGIDWDGGATNINIINNSHYITETLATGTLSYSSNAESLAYLTGSTAPDLQKLANSASGSALVVIAANGSLYSGGTASGRRVQLPWGGNDFDVNALTADGLTIMQRAIEWGSGLGDDGTPVSFCNADYIADNKVGEFATTSYSSTSIKGLTYLPEGKIFKGVTTPAGGTWISVDSNSDEIYMTDLTGSLLTTNATPGTSPTGVSFISSGTYADHLVISDYWAQGIAFVDLNGTVVNSMNTSSLGATNPSDVAFIGTTAGGSYDGMLALLNVDRMIYIIDQSGSLQATIDATGITSQAEGIVHLPGKDLLMLVDRGLDQSLIIDFNGNLGNSYSITSFGSSVPYAITVDPVTCAHVIGDLDVDKIITLDNSGGGGGPPPPGSCNGSFRDEFNAQSYSGSDGTLNWATDWFEVGESDGPTSGDERVRDDESDFQLRIKDNDNGGEGVEREADLSGATSASLSFDYRLEDLDDSSDYVNIEISTNGATGPWNQLTQFIGPGNDSNYSTFNTDISNYISSNTRIRFITSPGMGGSDIVWFDNVEIQCSP